MRIVTELDCSYMYAESCQRGPRNNERELMRGVATTFVCTCKHRLVILDMYENHYVQILTRLLGVVMMQSHIERAIKVN